MRSEWYTVVDDERGTLRLEFNRCMVFLHLNLKRPMDGLRAVRTQFADLKTILRNLGYKAVHVLIPEDDGKLYRFEQWFGFREVWRGTGNILMRMDC